MKVNRPTSLSPSRSVLSKNKVNSHLKPEVKSPLSLSPQAYWEKGSSIVRGGKTPDSSFRKLHDGTHYYLGKGFSHKDEAYVEAFEAGLSTNLGRKVVEIVDEDGISEKVEVNEEISEEVLEQVLQAAAKGICTTWYDDHLSWKDSVIHYLLRGFNERDELPEIRAAYLTDLAERDASDPLSDYTNPRFALPD